MIVSGPYTEMPGLDGGVVAGRLSVYSRSLS